MQVRLKMSMATTIITGEVGAIKGIIRDTTIIITTTIVPTATSMVGYIEDTAVEEAEENIKEEGLQVEYLRMGTKSAEEILPLPR